MVGIRIPRTVILSREATSDVPLNKAQIFCFLHRACMYLDFLQLVSHDLGRYKGSHYSSF